MKIALPLIRGYVLFVGLSFLGGQLFFGYFEWSASVGGLCAVLAAVFTGGFATRTRLARIITIGLCVVALVAVGFNAYQYYAHYNTPGNYYAWFMIGPYCAGLALLIGYLIGQDSAHDAA
jgi:hypothetical protein